MKSFLKRNQITNEQWEKADIKYGDLLAIAEDHDANTSILDKAAELLAKILNQCPQVHSVRWRVKDSEHLMEKIVRKRAENNEKYLSIDVANYTKHITDLVGIRVLHLFKHEWKDIHQHILNNWKLKDTPVAYIRDGDKGDIIESYKKYECSVKPHGAGYRSIHYIISTEPINKVILSEIQVRTIFEEGWSEIDHKIRYPNLSNNQLTSVFLTIFNRLAGSADEMGSFVKLLTEHMSIQEELVRKANLEQEISIDKIDQLAQELIKEQEENKSKSRTVNELSEELKRFRGSLPSLNSWDIGRLTVGESLRQLFPTTPPDTSALDAAILAGTKAEFAAFQRKNKTRELKTAATPINENSIRNLKTSKPKE